MNAPAPPRSAGRDSVQTLLFNGAAAAVGVVTGIIVAKALGPAGKGEYAGLSLLQNAIASVTGGIGSSITYHLTKERHGLSDVAKPLLVIFAALCLIVPGALALWGLRFGFDPAILVFAATVPAALVLSWQQGILLGIDQVRSLNVQMLGLAVFTLIAVAAAIVARLGVPGAMWAWSICTYGAALVVIARAAAKTHGPPQVPFRQVLGSLTHYGARAALFGVLGFLNYRIDSLVLIAYLGASGFGVYSVAVAAGEILFRVPRAVATATTYRVGSGDFATSASTTAKAIRTSTWVIGACAVPLFILAPWLVHAFYGAKFEAAAPALRMLLPGIIVFASSGLYSPFFALQMGRPMVVVYISLVMIAIQTGTGIWLVPRMGLMGAAIASTATYLTAAVFVTWYFCRVTKLAWTDVWILRRDDVRSLMRLLPRAGPSGRASSGR